MPPAPLLLTPGPLTTSAAVKQAMLHDYGARDGDFIDIVARLRADLLRLANGDGTHSCVPLQGSGTFAVEAMLANLLPPDGKLLSLVNGAYGERIAEICRYLGRETTPLRAAENEPPDPAAVDAALAADPAITHVSLVYCETTSGILNPLREIAAVVHEHGRALLLDAMSAFGALPLDLQATPCAAVAASANKCLQGVPGMGFVLAESQALRGCVGNAHSLSLDLHAQWQGLERDGQWRFTPPVQCLLALRQALRELEQEGGPAARLRRYQDNADVLLDGMTALGFTPYLAPRHQAPIIVTFLPPDSSKFVFADFHRALRQRGFSVYPGKLPRVNGFRVGCIGDIGPEQMRAFVAAVKEAREQ